MVSELIDPWQQKRLQRGNQILGVKRFGSDWVGEREFSVKSLVAPTTTNRPYAFFGYGGGLDRRNSRSLPRSQLAADGIGLGEGSGPQILVKSPTLDRSVKITKSMARNEAQSMAFDLTAARRRMMKSMVRYEEDAIDSTAVWRIVHLRPPKEPRKVPDLVQPRETELEMARGVEDPRQINLSSTQEIQPRGASEGNPNFPLTGFSVVVTGWEQDPKDFDEVCGKHEVQLEEVSDGIDGAVSGNFGIPSWLFGFSLPDAVEHAKDDLSVMDKNVDSNEVGEVQRDESALKGSDAKTKPNDPIEAPSQPVDTNDKAEAKKGVNESGDEDKINKDVAVKTNLVMANVFDEVQFDLAQLYMGKRADKKLRGTGLFWKTPPWPDFCIEELTAVYKSELMKMRHEVEEERMMLLMARVWRVERVQRKLVVAKLTADSKYAPLNKLQSDLEESLSFHRGNSVDEEIHMSAEESGDSRIAKKCLRMLRAMRSHQEYNYVAYRKGIGVACNKKGGFGVGDIWLWSTGLLWNLPPWPDLSLCEADWMAIDIENRAAAMCLRMAAMFGGIVGQEVVQACSGKFHPVYQFFYFDSVEPLPVEPLESGDLKPENTRYAAQISVFGSELRKKLEQEDFMGGAEIIVFPPVVSFSETVLEKSSCTVMSKFQNKHNRIFMEAWPRDDGLAEAIDEGRIGPRDDTKVRSKILTEEFGWDKDLAKKIWGFRLETTDPNMVVDVCKGVQYPYEIKDSVVAGFQWASKEDPLAEENMHGICFEVCDVIFHADASHRGGVQVTPTARRVISASQLTAKPGLLEPVNLMEIKTPENALGGIHGVLNQKGRHMFEKMQRPGTPLYNITALRKCVMQTWLPASNALSEMTIFYSPSPSKTQKHRVDNLYEGPLDDIYAIAIRNCDSEGPLMLHVSKMVPASDNCRFFALGRVFSGMIAIGMKVHSLTMERVIYGSQVGILHSFDRNGTIYVGLIGLDTFWKGGCSDLQVAEAYCVGQFVRLEFNISNPHFEWQRKSGGGFSTDLISQKLLNGCLVVKFTVNFNLGEVCSCLADPYEVEVVSFGKCEGIVKKYEHIEDFHWAVRLLLITMGLFTAIRLGIFVVKSIIRPKSRKAIGLQDVLATLLNNSKVQERQNHVCTTVAITIVVETCSPFTVLPALMKEYKIPELNVQNGVLKYLSFLFEYIGEMGKDYIYAVAPLLENALMHSDLVHRQTAASAVKHMVPGVAGLGYEDALVHLLNFVWPNIFETSPHVITAAIETIDGMRVALGAAVILNYCIQGLFHPARKVREVYWKIYNSLYIGAQDALVAAYPGCCLLLPFDPLV